MDFVNSYRASFYTKQNAINKGQKITIIKFYNHVIVEIWIQNILAYT